MDAITLGDFIEAELRLRNMSAREFARFIDVPNSLINKYRNHGLTETYAGKPVGDPSIEFLVKLSKATHVDICSLLALVVPDSGVVDIEDRILVQMITRLSPDKREIAETYLQGLAFQASNELKQS